MTAPKVSFRALTDDDRDRLLAWRNSPEVAAYMYSDHAITVAEHGRWFAGLKGDRARAYWIIEMDRTPVGLVNLYDIDSTAGTCAWAYYLADPSTRGKGIGAYVELVVLDHVLIDRAFHRLDCEVLVDNEAVWKLHQSFGFDIVGRLEARAVKGGVAKDALKLALTAERWAQVRGACAARLAERGFAPASPLPAP